jgi:hypothetical protein
MSRILFSLVSVLLLSLASTSYGLVLGDFEANLDGWAAADATLTFSPIGATVNWLAMQVTGPGGWHIDAKLDMKPNRAALGVKGTTITADVTALEADMTTTWMQVGLVINGQNNNDAGANNNIGWKELGLQNILRDGQPHTYTWAIPDDLAAAIAATDGNIGWFELMLVSNLDGASVTKFYVDNVQVKDPAKKIVWVSAMYPSTADANVPSDQGFVDLLTAAGYKVDYQKGTLVGTGWVSYWETLDPNKLAVLDAADLVILARGCNSAGMASDANEIAAWGSVKTPVMLMSSYIAANNRWKWVNVNSQDARRTYYMTKAVDPNHPLFEGVALDANDVVQWYDPNAASGYASFINFADAGNGTVLAVRPDNGNMLIAEWPAGQEFYAGSGQIPADVRMLFSAGTQEVSGQKTNWGVMNLNDAGQKIFLNAVNYMLNPPLPPATNLLTNGNFETGTSDTWGIWGSTFEVVTELVGAAVPEAPIEGQYCLHVTVPNKTANFWDTGMNTAPPIFAAGKKYTLSVWLKSKSGPATVNLKPEHSADPWEGYGEKQVTMTDTWAEYSLTTPEFATDVSPASITFHLGFAQADFWVDNVQWYEGEYVAP